MTQRKLLALMPHQALVHLQGFLYRRLQPRLWRVRMLLSLTLPRARVEPGSKHLRTNCSDPCALMSLRLCAPTLLTFPAASAGASSTSIPARHPAAAAYAAAVSHRRGRVFNSRI